MEDKINSGNAAVEIVESNAAPKKTTKNKAKAQQQKKVSSRPPTSEMVTAAIKELKDRKGSSFQAIKKYIVSTYKVDGEKVTPFIKKYLKTAVSSGAVVQTKGKDATGSFKLSTDKPKPKSKGKTQGASVHSDTWKAGGAKKEKVEKTKKLSAVKKTAMKKAAESPKKQPAQKKTVAKATVKKSKAATESKSPSKAKKAVKAPAAKTKTPKPKKATTTKAVKAAAKK